MASHEFSARNPIEEAILNSLYDALRSDQLSPNEPSSGVAVGALDLRRSAIFLATEANWHMIADDPAFGAAAPAGTPTTQPIPNATAEEREYTREEMRQACRNNYNAGRSSALTPRRP
jgi:hypothetical protein